jgi:nitrate reductase gamma subunit
MVFFLAYFLPYLAVAVFLTGMAWRTRDWLKRPVPMPLALEEVGSNAASRAAAVTWELALFRTLFRGDRPLWLAAWTGHAAGALIFLGHLLGIGTLGTQFTWLGASVAASVCLSAAFGTAVGIIFIAALLGLFTRRIAIPEVKHLSRPADYFDLAILLAIASSGLAMRWTTAGADLAAVRGYLVGLATLHPAPLPDQPLFLIHFLLVNVLLLYFPFSKLVHLTGALVGRTLIVQPAPTYPTPSGPPRQAVFFDAGENVG